MSPHAPSSPAPQSPDRSVVRVVGRPSALDRPPLPAGHPISWGAITAGTVLADSCYPYPVWGHNGAPCAPPRLPGLWYLS